ncbi:hypothetical protein BTA51_13460 [Hahella sp. CCB-MM4]|uniref:DUF6531 domain-containing protein n=1 Tax=Hahella sp. (strain CCB-MM4) TaxID=1926491 RepID=UPI000B9BCCCE|nr:DUF6531 domain-containing protein [Hahella sp. CCB-MM4]OZG72961.1 hypothetical protein BTA51_13460 [Hahella sp. CCB-MM4]
MLAAKHFDPVLGIDIHLVIPPTGTPLPIPHPHIGIVFDVMDYLPIFGGTIKVNGVPRATAGTAGKPIPHIPMGGPFSMPPGNEDEIFMGSTTVVADGAPFTFTALPVLSCQSVGMMAPIRAKKPKKSYGMVLPTTTVLPIPVGNPVMVGGPPTVDVMGMAMTAGMAGLGAAFKKMRKMQKGSKRVKKVSDAIHKKADKMMDKMGVPPSARHKVHKSVCAVTGHPVDVASGKVFTDWIDFELPGPIPLSWERTWYSTSTYQGPLGHGWHHNYDWRMAEEGRTIAVIMPDGRGIAFPVLNEGEESFDRRERMTLFKDSRGYGLRQINGNLLRFTEDKNLPTAYDAETNQGTRIYKLAAITDSTGEARISFYYNLSGHLDQIIDSGGRHIQLENDTEGRVRKIYLPHPDPDKGNEYYCAVKYDYREDDLISMQDAMGSTMAYKYKNHLLYQETNFNGLNFYFKYDDINHHARCIHTWGDDGIYNRRLTYNVEENITVVEDSLGHQTTYYHNGVLPYKVINALKAEVLIKYNQYFQIECETDAEGYQTRIEYDNRGNTTKVVNPDGTKLEIEYNQEDAPVRTKDAMGHVWLWQYDKCRRLLSKMDPLDRTTSFTYSGFKVTSLKDPTGKTTLLSYDSDNNPERITAPDGTTQQWKFDKHGRVILDLDAKGNQRRLQYDLLGRVIQITEPDNTIKTYEYDPEGNVTKATDNQRTITFKYQGMGRMVSRTQAGTTVNFEYNKEEQLTGIINEYGYVYKFELDPTGEILAESGFDGLLRHYQRDKCGFIKRQQRPGNRFSNFDYDAMGRITRISHSDGSEQQYHYRPDGALIKAINNSAIIEFERDALGQIIREKCNNQWVSSEYDPNGMRIHMHSSLGAEQFIQRDVMGGVIGVKSGDQQLETLFTRDELGQELERHLPGGIKNRWTRDKVGRPISQHLYIGDTLHATNQYFWSENNRIEKVYDSLHGVTIYNYDSLGTLVSARYGNGVSDLRVPDSIGSLFQTYSFHDREYGPAGQLLSIKKHNGVVHFDYDVEGNLITKTEPGQKIWQYDWSDSGVLKKVTRPDGLEVLFEYDAFGRRLKKTFNGLITQWIWDGNNPLHEWVKSEEGSTAPPSSGISRPADIYFDDEHSIPQITPHRTSSLNESEAIEHPITWYFEPETFRPLAKQVGDSYFSIIPDHQGTPTAMFSQTGEKVWSASISVWGKLRNIVGNRFACPFRWQGQYEDKETGLYYNRYRYYDPDAGQYIRQDPLGLRGGLNAHSYVKDPISEVDPFGLSANLFDLKIGQIHPQTQNEILAVVEEGSKADFIVEGTKPSQKGRLVKKMYYENPGHHDVNGGRERYNPNKSVLPENHIELFEKSVQHGGARYAMDENGNIHQFQDSVNNTYHWAGQEGGRTAKGKVVPLRVPPGVREKCQG